MAAASAPAPIEVRPMEAEDLGAVLALLDTAFCGVIDTLFGRKVEPPFFAPIMPGYRLSADPAGCHVAVAGGAVVGANFSLARGSIGWFGPLAVDPKVQGRGIAQALVEECLASWNRRGVRLMGLETFANSSLHVNLYMKLGFRPSWTGVGFRLQVAPGAEEFGKVIVNGPVPDLDYLYPGFDAGQEAGATRAGGVGVTLALGSGYAVCHFRHTLSPDPAVMYLPLVVAPDRETFDGLMAGVEAVARRHRKSTINTQVSGSSWPTQEALLERGYRPGSVSLRMKRGEDLDYEMRGVFYCDDWH